MFSSEWNIKRNDRAQSSLCGQLKEYSFCKQPTILPDYSSHFHRRHLLMHDSINILIFLLKCNDLSTADGSSLRRGKKCGTTFNSKVLRVDHIFIYILTLTLFTCFHSVRLLWWSEWIHSQPCLTRRRRTQPRSPNELMWSFWEHHHCRLGYIYTIYITIS